MNSFTKFIIAVTILVSCNVYELVDQGNKVSDEFEELLSLPRVSLSTYEVSITDINAAGTPGLDVVFTIANATFNDTITAGDVDGIGGASISGSVANLTPIMSVSKTASNKFSLTIKNTGPDATISGTDVFLDVQIPPAAYTNEQGRFLNQEFYSIRLVP